MRISVPLLALFAAACSTSQQQAPRGAPNLGVEFSWDGVPPCSNESPRIVVTDVPAAARRLRVQLVDVDSAVSRHGGGDVAVPPGGVIPAGALKSYRGPCPSQRSIIYEVRVAALDAEGRVLAQGAERQTYTVRSLRGPSRSNQR